MDFDVSGLTPLDTTGLRPAGGDSLDVSGLTPLDVSGLTPVDDVPQPVTGPAGDDRTWADTPFTDRVLNPLTAGVLSLKQGAAGLGADLSGRSLSVMDRIDRGESVPDMDDPVGYQHMSPDQRAAARRQAETDISQSAGMAVSTGRQIADLPQNPAAQRMMGAKTWGDAGRAFWSDPLGVITSVGLQSLPAMAPALLAGAVGGPVAGGVAMGASSAGTEYLSSVLEGLANEGVDTSNEAALVQAFRNPEMMARVRDRAATRAGIIGAVDGATMGLAGKTLVPQVVKGRFAREALNIPAQIAAQGAMGGGAEAGAQIATEGRVTEPGQVLGEVVGEAFGAPAEVLALRHAGRPAVDVAPPNVTPADVASPIPTDLIASGRSIVDGLLAPKADVVDLPQGAVPAEVLLGQVTEPAATDAPVAPVEVASVQPVVDDGIAATPQTESTPLDVSGLTPLGMDAAAFPAEERKPLAPIDELVPDLGSVAQTLQQVESGNPELRSSAASETTISSLPPLLEAEEVAGSADQHSGATVPNAPTGGISTAAPAFDVTGLRELEQQDAPDDFPGVFRRGAGALPQPSAAQQDRPAAPPILTKSGKPFATDKAATLAARQRPDLKGQALEPVQVAGGWGLRPVDQSTSVVPEFVQLEAKAQQGFQGEMDQHPTPAPKLAQSVPGRRPPSLFEFLASKGGIQDQQGELRALDLRRQFLPRQGALVRRGGMTLDRARELAEEAGYIRPGDRAEGFGRTEITDLLGAMDREARGGKVYPIDEQADVAQQDLARRQVDEEATRRAGAEADVGAVLAYHGISLPDEHRRRAVEAVMLGEDPEDAVVDAIERDAIQTDRRYVQETGNTADQIPFEDIADAQQPGLQGGSPVAAPQDAQEPSALVRDEGRDAARREEPGRGGPDRGQAGSVQGQVSRATERTDQGEQFIVDGLRPVTDRDRVEAAMAKPLQPKKRQKAADDGLFDVAGRAQQDLFSKETASSAGARSLGIPKMADPPIFSHSDSARLKDHPDYTAAKAGDRAAAIRFVSDIVDPVTVDEARRRFGEDVIYAPAAAEEASGRNAIPATLAAYYAEFAGGTVEPNIIQTVRAHHTGAKPMERLISRPLFGGPVKPGGRYVLVDDVSTMGGTLAEMAHHIQANGGQVIGTITLANASREGQFSPTRLQVRTIEGRYGDAVRQLFGIAPTGLTADEARYILGFRDADALRAAATKAGDERNRRFGEAGVQGNATGEGSASPIKPNEGDFFRLAPEFERALPAIEADLRERLQRYGISDRVGLRLVDAIRDRQTGDPIDGAAGRYGRRVIEVALDARNRAFTFDHEVVHALRDLDLIKSAEWTALKRTVLQDNARMADVRARYPEFGRVGDRPELTDRLIEEAVADLFGEWQAGRIQAKGFVRTALERIRDFLRAVGQALRGEGFRTVDSVFRALDRGEIGQRGQRDAAPAGVLAEAHHAEIQPRDDQGRFVAGDASDRFSLEQPDPAAAPSPEAGEQRHSLMSRMAGAQPIDRVARIPFDLFGGLNDRNQWKPGLYLNRQAERIITKAEFKDDGRMRWMNTVLRKARAGLIDRYGLDAAYVERDRQRGLDERRIMAKVPELMKTLADQDVKPEEMATLQAVLTGEEIADARWSEIASPIRAAIDQLGAEAVELGLLSPESFERNRGKYLHRVYAKHEADQGSLAAWVDRKMTGRRRKIIGDQFKGRGMFMEVTHEALMRHTDEAQTARDRSGRLRMLEKRRDDLLRRRDVAIARAEERTDETAATMDRRMDTSEGSKALKRPGGATVVLKPNRYQKGQAREQGVALTRLNMKGQRARALIDKINGQLAEVNGKIVETETRLFAADDLRAAKGQKFRILDKMGETKEGGQPRVTHRAYLPEGATIPKDLEGYQDRGVWEVRGEKGGSKDGERAGKPVLWRDFTKDERQSMGEIVDARYTVAKTYMLMAHDLATGRFFRDIAGNAEWSRDGKDEPPSATWKDASEYSRFWHDPAIQWVKVPESLISKSNTKRYGALAGRFVRAEIWRDMAELEALQKPGVWDSLMRQWKANKTYRSPVVHMNNIMSNVMFMDMADVRATDLARGIRSLLKRDDLYREALDQGAFGSDMLAQEIREEVLKPILEEIERGGQGNQGGWEARFGAAGKLADRLWSGVKTADQKMQQAYQMEDEVFRMALYARRRGQGASAEQAALEARDTFLNYDIRAPWINAARRTVLPFISYTYRAAPMIARTIMSRPWKLAKYFTMMYALNALAYAWDGGDEDEERRSLRENEQGWAWTGVPRMMRLPTHDQHGNPVFLDVRRWIPAGDVFDTGQGQSVIPMPGWMQPGGPLNIAFELILNRSAFTGQDISNKYTDTIGERIGKGAGYVYKSWMPSAAWVPGSWYWDRIGNAITGARDWSGRPYSVPQAIASSVGIKVKPQDVEEGFASWGREFDRIERELEAEARRAGNDRERGLLSETGFERKMETLTKKFEQLGERRRERFTGASR